MKLKERLLKLWYFRFRNPVVWKGEKGGFKVVFRRFWMEARSVSGNWYEKWTAAEYPYAYLITAVNQNNEETLWGFCERMYMWSMILLRDKGLAVDMDRAVSKYEKRLGKIENKEDETVAIAQMRDLQETIEAKRDGKKR